MRSRSTSRAASAASNGGTAYTTSRRTSTWTPPKPMTTSGPNCASWTMPSSISTPVRLDHRRDEHLRVEALGEVA